MEKITGSLEVPREDRGILAFENVVCTFVFIFSTVLYGMTLCPTVFWWDSGELIANIAVLGIPHRPGFPIYLLLGKVFSFLPFFGFAFRVNLLSALFGSFSLAILYKTFQNCSRLLLPEMAKRKEAVLVSGLFFVLVLGFTYSFWIQAVRAEVYSLNMLFFSLLLFLSVRYLEYRKLQYIYLSCFLLGLGLGNHHLTLLSIVPSLFVLLLILEGRWFLDPRRIPFYALFCSLGLSVYLYLPVRSLTDPPLAWGKVKSISSSASSVIGFDNIRNLRMEFLSDIANKLVQIFSLLSDQLTLVCFTISLVGLLLLVRHNRKILAFLILLTVGNCAAAIFVSTELITTNPDLHGYLVFSTFALAFSFGVAILIILNRIGHSAPMIRCVSLIVLLAIALLPLFRHYPQANLSNNRIAYDYGSSVISDLESNSVLFADNVNLNFILRELQLAEGIRKDVTVIDRGLLSFDWYVDQQRTRNPLLFTGIPKSLTSESLFGALLKRCQELDRPTYMEFTERDLELVDYLTPQAYVFRVSQRPIEKLLQKDLRSQEKWSKRGPFHTQGQAFRRDWDAQRVFALSFYRLGLFYASKGMISSALDEFAKVREVDPENRELILRMKRLEALRGPSEACHPEHSSCMREPSGWDPSS